MVLHLYDERGAAESTWSLQFFCRRRTVCKSASDGSASTEPKEAPRWLGERDTQA
jgi:hypothetical protein